MPQADFIAMKSRNCGPLWRNRAADPLADPALTEVCETAARSCEALYATAG